VSTEAQHTDHRAPRLSRSRKLGFAVVTVAAALLLVEAGARLWLALGPGAGRGRAPGTPLDTRWLETMERDLPVDARSVGLYLPDAELFWRLRPGIELEVENVVYRTRDEPVRWSLRINEAGFRGHPYPEDAAAGPVVIALGDSCTFGYRVDQEQTYPAQLETWLRARGRPGASVVNYGVPGYSSFQGRRLLERILARHRPDVVLLAFGANDLERDRLSDAEKADRVGPLRFRLHGWLRRSAAARLWLDRDVDRRSAPGGGEAVRVSPDEYRENLTAMARAAREAGARVVLLDLVFVGPVYRDVVAAVAEAEGLDWLDGRALLAAALDDLLAGRRFVEERRAIDRFWNERVLEYRQVYYDAAFYERLAADPLWRGLLQYLMIEPVHPNRLGHAVIADALGRELLAPPPAPGD
jgi:lysophospholipase L1-like esterase